MLTDLLEVQDTWQFEEEGWLSIVSVVKQETELELVLRVSTGIEDEPLQLWKLNCHQQQTHKISLGNIDGHTNLVKDHVLLWSYNQPVASLTFRHIGETIDAFTAIGRLYEKHIQLVQHWIPFWHYFNPHLSLPQLIAGGHGKLAEAPEPLIISYQQAMQESGFQCSYLTRNPKQWDTKRGWIEESRDLLALILGESYVIATKVTAKRL